MCRVRTGTRPDDWRDDGAAVGRVHGTPSWGSRPSVAIGVGLPRRPYPGDPRLTERQREVLAAVLAAGNNRSLAARRLGCDVRNVQVILRAVERRGVAVPPGITGRQGIPDLRPRTVRLRKYATAEDAAEAHRQQRRDDHAKARAVA